MLTIKKYLILLLSFACMFITSCNEGDTIVRVYVLETPDDNADVDNQEDPATGDQPPVVDNSDEEPPNNNPDDDLGGNVPALEAKLMPPEDQTLFLIGQDIDTVNQYVRDLQTTPAGVTAYVSADGGGVYQRLPEGHGDLDLQSYLAGFPESALAVGLYMVGQEQRIADREPDAIERLNLVLEELKSANRPVYLRIGYEVDGYWNNYEPEAFISAWRYISDWIKDNDANNIATVWQLAAYCGTGGFDANTYQNLTYEAWWPGDEHVDWVGFSYFNQDRDCLTNSQTGGLPSAFGSLSDTDERGKSLAIDNVIHYLMSKEKPILIAESAPKYYHTGNLTYKASSDITVNDILDITEDGIWGGWFERYFERIEQYKAYIRGAAYINMKWDDYVWRCDPDLPQSADNCGDGYWGDSRIQAQPSIQQRFTAEINKSHILSSPREDGFSLFSNWNDVVLVDQQQLAYTERHLPHPVPGIIEAEDFDIGGQGLSYLDSDVQNRGLEFNTTCRTNEQVDTAPIGQGGCAVAFTAVNEWLEYSIQVAADGDYNIEFATASPGGGGAMQLSLDGDVIVAEIEIPDSGAFDIFNSFYVVDVPLPAGQHVLRVDFLSNGVGDSEQTPGNLDYINVIDPNAQSPFLGTAQPIPGKIEAEFYDTGGSDIGFVDLTTDPAGLTGGDIPCSRGDAVFLAPIGEDTGLNPGCSVAFTLAGESLTYSVNVTESALYEIRARVSNGLEGTARGSFELILDGEPLSDTASIPFTGDFNNYELINLDDVSLDAGFHELTLYFNNNGDVATPGNIDFVEFIRRDVPGDDQEPSVTTIISDSEETILNLGDYDFGGQGIAFNDTEEAQLAAINDGSTCRVDEAVDIASYDVCVLAYTFSGEWVEYTVTVENSGFYDLTIGTYAGGDGGFFYIQSDGGGVTLPIKVNSTGDFGTKGFETINQVYLQEGQQTLRLFMLENGAINSVGNLSEIVFQPLLIP